MFKYFKVICKLLFKFIHAYFSWLLPYSRHPEKYSMEIRYAKTRKLVVSVIDAFKVDITKYNFEDFTKVSSNNRLIICNHLSLFDPLIIIALSEKPVTFACKKEISKIPFLRLVIKALEGEYLDRDDLKQQLKVMRIIEDKLKTYPDLDWCIFPEGTRNKDPYNIAINELHHGTFRCATKSHSDITVISLFNTFKILDDKDKSKRYFIPVNFIKTLTFEDYKEKTTSDIAVEVTSLMEEAIVKDRELVS